MAELNDVERRILEKRAAQPAAEAKPVLNDVEQRILDKSSARTPAGTAIDTAKSLGSGFVSGAGDLANLAQNLTIQGMVDNTQWAAKKIGDYVAPETFKGVEPTYISPNLKKGLSTVTAGADTYEPKTTPGRYAKTVGEFLPGAALPIGGGGTVARLLYGAAVPGLASEAASDLTKKYGNEKYAPAARLATAVASPMATEALIRGALKAATPAAKVSAEVAAERLAKSKILDKAGLEHTAGQLRGDENLMARELATKKGQNIFAGQNEKYTNKVMDLIGEPNALATPDKIDSSLTRIVDDLGNIANSVDVSPVKTDFDPIWSAIKEYKGSKTSTTDKIPDNVVGTIQDIHDAFKTGTSISGSTLRSWRKDFGRRAASTTDRDLSSLYHNIVDSIDDMVSRELHSAGRSSDWEALEKAREQYRNWLPIRDASLKSEDGVLNPKHVFSALSSQSKNALATGNRGDLGDLTRAATIIKLPKQAPKEPVASRLADKISSIASGGAGYLLGNAVSPIHGLVGAGIGLGTRYGLKLLSAAQKKALMSDTAQNYMKGKKLPFKSPAAANKALATSLARDDEERLKYGRKAGGRVNFHEHVADKLVAAAERAKKMHSQSTQPLLNTPDDMVAKALQVANRSI